jgi:hypothetical protein
METQPVIVRKSVRHDVVMRAAVCVSPEHAAKVRFSQAAGARDGWLDVDVVDFATGGLGFVSSVFIPRRCVLTVRIFGPEPDSPARATLPVRVQRVAMTDRRPAYLVGTAFEKPAPEAVAAIDSLMDLLGSESGAGE